MVNTLYKCLQGRLRLGGMTPALALRMRIITDDVVYANRGRQRVRGTAKEYIH